VALTPLFDSAVPPGFRYQREFIHLNEEAGLVDAIGRVEFSTFEMRGVVARRRVAFFGRSYDPDGTVTPPLPAFLLPLREQVAAWAGLDPAAFEMALINEYPPGAPIGWHRDAPQYDIVAGISLVSACRIRFRPYVRSGKAGPEPAPRRTTTHELLLEPRSVYLLTGPSRTAYEHHIPAVDALRYSITFRTLRS
jgi:alkylated DNA repair dioxygenase AlkB